MPDQYTAQLRTECNANGISCRGPNGGYLANSTLEKKLQHGGDLTKINKFQQDMSDYRNLPNHLRCVNDMKGTSASKTRYIDDAKKAYLKNCGGKAVARYDAVRGAAPRTAACNTYNAGTSKKQRAAFMKAFLKETGAKCVKY